MDVSEKELKKPNDLAKFLNMTKIRLTFNQQKSLCVTKNYFETFRNDDKMQKIRSLSQKFRER